MTRASYRATIDAQTLVRQLDLAARNLRRDVHDAVVDVASSAEEIYAVHALRDTGRLARGIRARVTGPAAAQVTAHARNPESGFDYVAVTRFGHRLRIIRPRRARALRLPWGWRAWARGFKPRGDWADRALPQIKTVAEARVAPIGRNFVVRVRS